ncbi:Mu transposase C-terminal domain-containing protein [Gloeothece citriformis]|uniref:Mu transposase C-terminal domain-containing protein n=1 Tax=Gloeothece citriformis TaxID=2546356 RepID=UPI000173D2E8|nr:Mu transposase C-terminal domain-containing protein [Gloeothece citriformis]
MITEYNQGRQDNKLVAITVYKYLRKFWQRGKVKNALLPDYVNSGGKGKRRKAGSQKRGRPRKYKHDPEIGEGINITEQDRQIFRIAINKFYRNQKQNSLMTVYKLMIKNYYAEEFHYNENNVKFSVLIPPEKQPTFTQFRYWYETENSNLEKTITARRGAKRFALEHRAILGTSKQETIGPGSRYQIDATVADVYLVSQYNRDWIIGRPVIYVIIDVFSRMIVGVYVGLEGPSWLGAMMALSNVASDKVLFCQEYGLTITEEQWPCHHIPESILGDRGELAGMTVETMIPNLFIRIENAAPYRADWKGLVERHFKVIHEQVKPFLPGFVDKDFRQRGARDYRLDARLDINQFTEIILELIFYHNAHELKTYNRDEEMIADDVPPIPLELWKWGIMKRSGKLRTINEDIVKLNLMPSAQARITERGIRFKSMYYTCEKAINEMWFEKARSQMLSKSEKSLSISYDPRKMDFIYLRSPDGRDFEKCFLLDPDERYTHKTIYEVEYLLAYEDLQKRKREGEQLQNEVDLMAKIESIASRAQQETEKYQDKSESNKQKNSGIREHRAQEKAQRREVEAFELKSDNKPSSPQKIEKSKPESKQSHSSNSSQPNHLDLLAQKRQERKRGK